MYHNHFLLAKVYVIFICTQIFQSAASLIPGWLWMGYLRPDSSHLVMCATCRRSELTVMCCMISVGPHIPHPLGPAICKVPDGRPGTKLKLPVLPGPANFTCGTSQKVTHTLLCTSPQLRQQSSEMMGDRLFIF